MSKDKDDVSSAFRAIARRYDLMNTLCSFGAERSWRQKAVAALDCRKEMRILDLCAGTMTVSADVVHAAAGVRVTAVDFCAEMLHVGERRLKQDELLFIDRICAEGEKIPVRSDTHDGAIATYGVRNLYDPAAGMAEVFRVLKPGGKFVILEFTRPTGSFFAPLFRFYTARVMPVVGGIVAGSRGAYDYLSRSIGDFMDPEQFMGMMEKAGFRQARLERHTAGIVGIYTALKPKV